MPVTVNARDLALAVEAGILTPGQDAALLAFLDRRQPGTARFQLAHVAFYFGALLMMGALGWLMTEAWMDVGDAALLGLSTLYFVAFTVCGHSLWKRGQIIPGGLLGAVAVSLTPLAIFALERLTGLWPMRDAQDDYVDYYRYVHSGWLGMEAATLVVGVAMLRLLPFPFITLPMALAAWFMSMDLTEWVYGVLDWNSRCRLSLAFGLVLLLVSLLVDGRSRRDFAFWGYLAGLLAFSGGLSLMSNGNELGKALYGLIHLTLMGCAVMLRRPVFMVFGALGVAGYLGHLSHSLFRDSLLFPIVLTLIGLGVIGLGLLYQKHRDALTGALRSRLPDSLSQLLPALQR